MVAAQKKNPRSQMSHPTTSSAKKANIMTRSLSNGRSKMDDFEEKTPIVAMSAKQLAWIVFQQCGMLGWVTYNTATGRVSSTEEETRSQLRELTSEKKDNGKIAKNRALLLHWIYSNSAEVQIRSEKLKQAQRVAQTLQGAHAIKEDGLTLDENSKKTDPSMQSSQVQSQSQLVDNADDDSDDDEADNAAFGKNGRRKRQSDVTFVPLAAKLMYGDYNNVQSSAYSNRDTNYGGSYLEDDYLNDYGVDKPISTVKLCKKLEVKLDKSNLPKFSGAREDDINEWLFRMDFFIKANGLSDHEVIPHVVQLLKGDAFHALKRFMRCHPDKKESWIEFSKFLKKAFEPVDKQRELMFELKRLSPRNGFEQFVNRFEQISYEIDNISEQNLIYMFMEAMFPKTRTELETRRPDTLNDAIAIARSFERMHKTADKERSSHVNYANSVFPKRTNWKQSQLIKGGYNKTFDKQGTRIEQSNRTYNGTNNGTYNGNGNRWNNGNKDFYQGNKKNGFSNNNKLQCYKCKKFGHISKDCNSKKAGFVNKLEFVTEKMDRVLTCQGNSDELLSTTALIDNKKSVVSFDSGATVSVIATRMIKKLDIDVFQSDRIVKTADNAISQVRGITKSLPVNVHGHVCDLEFIVLDNDDHEVLLGLDWFMKTSAMLHPAEKRLIFPGQSLLLNNSDNSCENTFDYENQVLVGSEEPFLIGNPHVRDCDSSDIEDDCIEFSIDKDPNNFIPNGLRNKLNDEENKALDSFLDRTKHLWEKVIAKDASELGVCKVGKFSIRTRDSPPVYTSPYKKSISEETKLAIHVKEMLNTNIIERCDSEWNSPIFLVPKKDGSERVVLDFRKLNFVTVSEPFPIPNQHDIFDRVAQSKWFAQADCTSGFWQIALDEESKDKTAFTTRDGRFRFTRMPFGLKNAPCAYSKYMKIIFGNFKFVEVYIDDLTIHSKNFLEHLMHIERVLIKLAEVGLKIKPSKCKWFETEVLLLGHIISGTTVKMDPKKISAIRDRVPPRNVKEVQEFLGICNYYRIFVMNFARIAKPLFNLLKKETPFTWSEDEQNSFERLKNALTSYPILRQPDFERQFVINVDASGYCLGACLCQIGDDGNEYVVHYSSRLLKGAELNYGISEKECLGVVWAIKMFRNYVYGTMFVVVSDHSALIWLMNMSEPTGKFARWITYLQSFTMEIRHRAGSKHSNADALSRPPRIESLNLVREDNDNKLVDPIEDENLLHFLKFGKHASGLPKKQVKRIELMALNFKYENGQLYQRKNSSSEFKIVPRIHEREEIASKAHLFGHFQEDATVLRLQEKYIWRNMRAVVRKVIDNCIQCVRHQKSVVKDHPAQPIKISGVLHRIGIDLVFGLPTTTDGYKGILVIVDSLSKYVWTRPIKSKTEDEIAENLKSYIATFGPPLVLLSDQGSEFCNKVVDRLLSSTGIEHRTTSAYHPRTNGQTERTNGVLIESLRKYADENPNDWPKWTEFVTMAYNSKVHTSTGFTPYELMFGRKINHFENWEVSGELEGDQLIVRTEEIKKLQNRSIPKALENIKDSQKKQAEIQNKNSNIETELLKVGQKVFVKVMAMQDKLQPKFMGPFTIVEITKHNNYILKNELGERMADTYPRSRLKIINMDANTGTTFIIERIVDVRKTKNGKYEYIVKWKNYGDKENTWEPESSFIDKTLLRKFHERQSIPKTRGRPPKHKLTNYLLSIIYFFHLFFGIFAMPAIKGEFNFCPITTNDRILHFSNKCNLFNNKPNKLLGHIKELSDVVVLSKIINKVNGLGYECYMQDFTVKSSMNFFGYKSTEITKKTVQLSKKECEIMILTKKCGSGAMNCRKNECFYESNIVPIFSWLSTSITQGKTCSISPRVIIARNDKSVIFDNCRPLELECRLDNSIVIWTQDIINNEGTLPPVAPPRAPPGFIFSLFFFIFIF